MNRKVLIIISLFMILFSRQSLMSQTPQVDSLPIYNLFYLSKYITASNLDSLQKEKVYNSLNSIIRNSNANITNGRILGFIDKLDGLKMARIKNVFLAKDNQEDLFSTFNSLLNDKLKLNESIKRYYEVRKVVENEQFEIETEINQLTDFVNSLRDIYGDINSIKEFDDKVYVLKTHYKLLAESQKTTVMKYVDIEEFHKTFKSKLIEIRDKREDLICRFINNINLQNQPLEAPLDNDISNFQRRIVALKSNHSLQDFEFSAFNDIIEQYDKLPDEQKKKILKTSNSDIKEIRSELNQLSEDFKKEKGDLNKKITRIDDSVNINKYRNKDLAILKETEVSNNKLLDTIVGEVLTVLKKEYLNDPTLIKTLASAYEPPTVQQIQITSMIHTAEQNAASSFKLPSESDLINAVAMFLAKRAKQEAMIWFIDRLKEDMHNPLIFDAFPNTFTLLRQTESYNTPNFGQAWRFALSQDLVKMPENLLESPWVNEIWGKKSKDDIKSTLQMFQLGATIFELIRAQYNYRDIIKYVHLNRKKLEVNATILNYFDYLYMLTNELYVVDNTNKGMTYRLLTYEELSSLTNTQLEVLVELVKIKYDPQVSNLLSATTKLKEKVDFRQLGKVLLSLSQLDKIRESSDKTTEEKFSASSLWANLANIIDQIDFETSSTEYKNVFQSTKKHLNNFKAVIEIYENIQSKKFDLVSKGLVDLLDNVIRKNNSHSGNFLLSFNSKTKGLKFNENEITSIQMLNGFNKNFELSFAKDTIFVRVESVFNLRNEIDLNSSILKDPKTNVEKLYEVIDKNLKKLNDKYKRDTLKLILNGKSAKINTMKGNEVSNFLLPFEVQKDTSFIFIFAIEKYTYRKIELANLTKELKLLNYLNANTKSAEWNSIVGNKLGSNSQAGELLKLLFKDSDTKNYKALLNLKLLVDFYQFKTSKELLSPHEIANTLQYVHLDDDFANKYGNKLIKLTSFFSDMFYASDAKAMAAAIDRHALPPTSYTLKRKVPFSVTFNGYVGVYGGIKKFYSENEFITNSKDVKMTYGLTAPVGFTFSKSSGGVFLQLIDVGNLVGHYLWNVDPNETRPNVTFKEVISPGINFMHYINRSPFVIFGGIRGILLDEKNVSEKNRSDIVLGVKNYNSAVLDMIEFNVGVKIDIPIFNIYTKRN